MKRLLFYITFFIAGFLFIGTHSADAQVYKIKGTVYDSSRNFPLEAVSVLSTSGRGTITNEDGHYEIDVEERDSIWFSYLNKPTKKFPVLSIINPFEFDISLQVNVPTLREVKVRPRNYKLDSIQNRIDYAKIFNYQKPGLKPSVIGGTAGFDLDELINVFRFRRNKSIAAFKERLLMEEREKAIDHRFNKALVRRLTLLDSAELSVFMRMYRPSYEFTLSANDYDFHQYIKISFYRYKRGIPANPALKKEEE